MIDGNAIGDVGNIVLRDRKVLSEDGIFIVAITVNKKERKIVSKARVNTRGFVYVKKSRDILRESADIVNATVENYLAGDSIGENLKVLFVMMSLSSSLTKPNVAQQFFQSLWKYVNQ